VKLDTGTEDLLCELRDDGVLVATLNRPETRNAFSAAMGRALGDIYEMADTNDAVRVVVVTGTPPAFCAGADFSRGADVFERTESTEFSSNPVNPPAWKIRKPVIAAINGHAVGVGITYPMLCDIRIVSETAKIQYAMVRRGILPELGSHVLLPRVIGFSRAADLLLTGRLIMGTEAAEMGLASRAVPADQVLAVATEMARDIAVNVSPVSAALAKQLMWDGMNTSVDHMIMTEGKLLPGLTAAPDSGEGVRAFFEKRAPKWRSRVSSDMPVIPK